MFLLPEPLSPKSRNTVYLLSYSSTTIHGSIMPINDSLKPKLLWLAFPLPISLMLQPFWSHFSLILRLTLQAWLDQGVHRSSWSLICTALPPLVAKERTNPSGESARYWKPMKDTLYVQCLYLHNKPFLQRRECRWNDLPKVLGEVGDGISTDSQARSALWL